MSEAQDRAWAELSPRYLIDVARDIASTSIRPGAELDIATAYGRTAPLIVEIGSRQGHAIVHAATSRPDADFLAVEVFRALGSRARCSPTPTVQGAVNLRLVEANCAGGARPPACAAASAAGGVDLLPRPVAQDEAQQAPGW